MGVYEEAHAISHSRTQATCFASLLKHLLHPKGSSLPGIENDNIADLQKIKEERTIYNSVAYLSLFSREMNFCRSIISVFFHPKNFKEVKTARCQLTELFSQINSGDQNMTKDEQTDEADTVHLKDQPPYPTSYPLTCIANT